MSYIYRITARKLFKSRTFWIMLLLYAFSMSTLIFGIEAFIKNITINAGSNSPIPIPEVSVYVFPNIWQSLSYLAGFLKLFPALILIIFVSAEYSYKTNRQHIMNGMSRESYFFSQLIFMIGLALFSTLLLFVLTLFLGFQHTSDMSLALVFSKSYYSLAYFLELLAFLSIAFFTAIILKRSGLAIIVFLLLYSVLEPVARFYFPEIIAHNMPFKAIGNLIDVPNTSLMKLFGVNFRTYIDTFDLLLVFFYTGLFSFFSYLLIKKRDL